MHFSSNSLSRGISFLNKLKKNGIFFNSSLKKFGFSTNDIYNNTVSHENSFRSLNESWSLNRSHMFAELGAKKISSQNPHITEEIVDQTSEKVSDKKSIKSPTKKAKLNNTNKISSNPKKHTEKENMKKVDYNANKSKKGEKKANDKSSLDKSEKISEGNSS